MTRVNSIKDIGAVYASMKQAANEKAKATEGWRKATILS